MGGFIVGCLLAFTIILIIALGKKLANKRKKNDNVDVVNFSDDNTNIEEKENK